MAKMEETRKFLCLFKVKGYEESGKALAVNRSKQNRPAKYSLCFNNISFDSFNITT